MANVTVYTDASWCPTTNAGGWGAWLRRDDTVRMCGGPFKTALTDSNIAEMAAAANGIYAATRLGLAQPGDLIIVVTDNSNVKTLLADPAARHHPRFGAVIQAAQAMVADNGVRLRVNKVKGHSRHDGARSYVNSQVDKEARKHMEAMRAGRGTTPPRAAASPASDAVWPTASEVAAAEAAAGSGILAFHATTSDIDQFRPLSHFGTAKAATDRLRGDPGMAADGVVPGARTYPVRLGLANPLALNDLGNHTAIDLMAALWQAKLTTDRAARLAIKVCASKEKEEAPADFAVSCARAGLLEGGLWLRDRPAAEQQAAFVSPEQLTKALWARYNHPAALHHMVRSGVFPQNLETCRHAERLVVNALEHAGHDGVVYANGWEDKGSLSYIILRPDQARILASPAAEAALTAAPPGAARTAGKIG